MSEENEIELKAILLGDSGVGKTNLINTCVGLEFKDVLNTTLSGSYIQKELTINNKKYLINLWDTAGQETYQSITKLFIKGSEIVIFVYDITDIKSFEHIEDWINICNEIIDNPNYLCGIIGNKSDLYLNEQISEEKAKKYAKDKNMPFAVVSAKENPKIFENFIIDLIKGNKNDDYQINKNGRNSIELIDKDSKKKKKRCFGLF